MSPDTVGSLDQRNLLPRLAEETASSTFCMLIPIFDAVSGVPSITLIRA